MSDQNPNVPSVTAAAAIAANTTTTKTRATHNKHSGFKAFLVDEKSPEFVCNLSKNGTTTIGSGEGCKIVFPPIVIELECAVTISRTAEGLFVLTPHYNLRMECNDSPRSLTSIALKDNDAITLSCMPGAASYRYCVMHEPKDINEFKLRLSKPVKRTIKITPKALTPKEKLVFQRLSNTIPKATMQYPQQPLSSQSTVSSSSSLSMPSSSSAVKPNFYKRLQYLPVIGTAVSSLSSGYRRLPDVQKDISSRKARQNAEKPSLFDKSPLDMYFSSNSDDSASPFKSCTYIDTMRQIDETSRKRLKEQNFQQKIQPQEPLQRKTSSVMLDPPQFFRNKLQSPDSITESLEDLDYFLDTDKKEQLIESLYVILHRPDLATLLSNPRPVSHTVLLHCESGTEKFMEKLGKAVARHLGAHVFVIGREDFRKYRFFLKPEVFDCMKKRREFALQKDLDSKYKDDKEDEIENDDSNDDEVEIGDNDEADDDNEDKSEMEIENKNENKDKGKVEIVFGPVEPPKTNGKPTQESGQKPQPKLRVMHNVVCSQCVQYSDISKGDRVKYDGTSLTLHADRSQRRMGPDAGATGTVLVRVEKLAGVEFDRPFPGGTDLGGLCKKGHGAFVNVKTLRHDVVRKNNLLLDWVYETVSSVGPCIILMKNAEYHALAQRDRKFRRFIDRIAKENLPVAILGTTTVNISRDILSSSSGSSNGGGGGSGGSAAAIAEQLGFVRLQTSWTRDTRTTQVSFLRGMFTTRISLKPPLGGLERTKWLEHIRKDVEDSRFEINKKRLQNAIYRTQKEIVLKNLDTIPLLRTTTFTRFEASRIISYAVSEHFRKLSESEAKSDDTSSTSNQIASQTTPTPAQNNPIKDTEEGLGTSICNSTQSVPTGIADGDSMILSDSFLRVQLTINLSASDISEAVDMIQFTKPNTSRVKLSEANPSNEFEKSLLSDVVPPDEAGISFADIGALEPVKEILQEAVILPLQRPELFRRGNLARPTSGILLFGPPGTGKTMLARAIATESGANFISITPSSITSMWYGESEKYVRALFGLATKIAPTIIFVDEVDSILGRRGDSHEHESSRKVKNEFMSCWDGLRTSQTERVVVLAATNRPMDLDDAVLRRLTRRIMVDLPDIANREKILRVILKDEELESGFDFAELARKTEGYSGSDLKALCVNTAYKPIRELVKREKKELLEMGSDDCNDNNNDGNINADVLFTSEPIKKKQKMRDLKLQDFIDGMEETGKSISEYGVTMNELKKWNKIYGDNGRKTPTLGLSYFT